MADKRTRSNLETIFSSGNIPTEDNFADLIASSLNQVDDGIQKAADIPLKILAPPASDNKKGLILFYEDFQQNPVANIRLDDGKLALGRVGESDLLIDKEGNIGIGTDKPGDYKIFARTAKDRWGYRLNNDQNESNVHMAHGDGYGLHVNSGTNATASNYILQLYSNNGIGPNTKLNVFGDGRIKSNAHANGWGFDFQNEFNDSFLRFGHGKGYGASLNGGKDTNADTYLLQISSMIPGPSTGRVSNLVPKVAFTVRGDGDIGIGVEKPLQKVDIRGHMMMVAGANNDNARAFLQKSSTPNATLLFGGIWDKTIYFYFKGTDGKVYRKMLTGESF